MKLYITKNAEYNIFSPELDLLAPARREKVAACRREDAARGYFAAGALLYGILGVSFDSRLILGENGKPSLSSGTPRFSLSHGGDFTVMAVDDREVGADIEKIAKFSPALAKRFFTSDERLYASDEARFFEIWTRKESVVKAAGDGIAVGFSRFSSFKSPVDYRGNIFYLYTAEHCGHIFSVASMTAEAPEIIEVTKNELFSRKYYTDKGEKYK